MTDMLIAPENKIFPPRKRMTVRECYEMMETGDLTGRWELIDGKILSKMGQKPPHSYTLNAILQWLIELFGSSHVRIQIPITISGSEGKYNEPEPDIAITFDPYTSYAERHPTPNDLLLIVEVSDTSLQIDLNTKSLLYAQAGVKEYWVADIFGRQMHCHRNPTPKGYAEAAVFGEVETVVLDSHPDASVRLMDLLPPVNSAS